MDTEGIKRLLEQVQSREVTVEDALQNLVDLPYSDLDFAKIDHHRALRGGYPEVIYGAGKTTEQILRIAEVMKEKGSNVLITRVEKTVYDAVHERFPEAQFNELGRTITMVYAPPTMTESTITVVTAGTSDIPVAEEAASTAELFGNRVDRIYDVGVAGIHRLFDQLPRLRQAKVIIVIAGMEGALASVVGGLVDVPIIAVPTSVGYGANFQGVTTLLAMLNSCASGITVVNIDNGFGAAYFASMVNHL